MIENRILSWLKIRFHRDRKMKSNHDLKKYAIIIENKVPS